MPSEWPEATRQFVEEEQERAYRLLGEGLGLGPNNPAGAYERLTGRPMPPQEASISKLREILGDSVPIDDDAWAQVDERAAALYRQYFALPLPTRYEDPSRYPSMAMTFDQVTWKYLQQGSLHDPLPLFATLPSGDPHARSLIDPLGGATVIFFEQGLFSYFYDFVKLVGWEAPPLSIEQLADDATMAQLPRRYTMPSQASQYFVATMGAYAGGSKSAGIPRPDHNILLTISLLSMMEQFVMAHEVAHIALGHLSTAPTKKQELLADTAAMAVVTAIARDNSMAWAVGYWACDLALVALNFLYRAIGVLAFGDRRLAWTNATHPDPLERRELLKALAGSEGPPDGVAAAGELIGMSEALFGRLWDLDSEGLRMAHNRGFRASPLWSRLIASTFETQG